MACSIPKKNPAFAGSLFGDFPIWLKKYREKFSYNYEFILYVLEFCNILFPILAITALVNPITPNVNPNIASKLPVGNSS